MKKSLFTRAVLIFLVLLVASFCTEYAYAFNWVTHKAMVEVAVYAMQEVGKSSATLDLTPPAGADVATWNSYIYDLRMAPYKLSLLRVGTLKRGDPDSINSTSDDPCRCMYRSIDKTYNLENTRIKDFWYIPRRPSQPVCQFIPVNPLSLPEEFVNRDRVLGGVLGWHAGMVDDHLQDVELWIRPWGVAGVGSFISVANDVWKYGVGALLVPFVCFWEWISGGDDCDWDHIKDLADDINPVEALYGSFGGIGAFKSDDYTGLWHYIYPNATTHDYNNPRGMFYPGAGPSAGGYVDLLIAEGFFFSGLGINAHASDGVHRYGKYDDPNRRGTEWQAESLMMLEWSPLQNLGQYGWDEFQKDPTQAYALGWPLHAIADASQTHHVIGTSSWGHRPAEDAVQENWEMIFPKFPLNVEDTHPLQNLDQEQVRRIIVEYGFPAWKMLKQNSSDIRPYLIDLARTTQGWMLAHPDVYRDGSSYDYFWDDKAAAVKEYVPLLEVMRPPIENAVGYMIGFLSTAAGIVRDPGFYDENVCPEGFHYDKSYYGGCANGPRDCDNDLIECMVPIRPCESNSDCCEGFLCDSVTKECRVKDGGACTSDAQCYTGSVCSGDYTCVIPQCHGLGESCEYNRCCAGLVCSDNVCYVIID